MEMPKRWKELKALEDDDPQTDYYRKQGLLSECDILKEMAEALEEIRLRSGSMDDIPVMKKFKEWK